MPKSTMPRSQKPLTEPKDIEFQTAKRQRVQDAPAPDKVTLTHVYVLVEVSECHHRHECSRVVQESLQHCVAVCAQHCNE